MLKIKLSLMMLSLIFLEACKIPDIKPVERCSVFLVTTLQDSFCVCHQYEFDVIGGRVIPPNVDHPLEYCNRGVVFNTDEGGAWETMVNWRDELLRQEEDE